MFNKKVLGFALYDFANSAYIIIFTAYLFPLFFRETLFGNSPRGDFYWGVCLSASIITAILFSPAIGHLADKGSRKRVFFYCILTAALGMALLSFLPAQSRLLFISIFILTNAVFVISQSLYDSFLPSVANKENLGNVSGFAWGMGYLGGVILLSIVIIAQKFFNAGNQTAFLITAIFYCIFSFLSLYLLPDSKAESQERKPGGVFSAVSQTLTKNIVLILIAFWFISEAIDTTAHFSSLYSKYTLQLSQNTIGILMLAMQLVAFPATWWIGKLADKKGERKMLNYTLVIWILIVIGIMLSQTLWHVAVITFFMALVFGSSQALMRSYYSRAIPESRAGLSFGFYSIVTRGSSFLGPLIFGSISSATGNQRIAVISIIVQMIIGTVIFRKIKSGQAVTLNVDS